MKVGDLIRLPKGYIDAWHLNCEWGILVEKLPRKDYLEYDWKIFTGDKNNTYTTASRQIEDACFLENYLTKEKNKNNIPA